MNDLYTKHPTKPNLWLYAGRADDLIVLSNEEKLNPTSIESKLRQHPSVKGALLVGKARFAPAAIIELKDESAQRVASSEEKVRFLEEEIWPYSLEANKAAPAHAQLTLDRIILSDPVKPSARAGMGTIQRGATVKLYWEEINEIYRNEDCQDGACFPKIVVTQNAENFDVELGRLVEAVVKITGLRSDQDFFTLGMDSLHIMTLVRILKVVLVGVRHDEINSRLVYSNPSLMSLGATLKRMAMLKETIDAAAEGTSRERRMKETLDQLVAQLPSLSESRTRKGREPAMSHW